MIINYYVIFHWHVLHSVLYINSYSLKTGKAKIDLFMD